MKNCLTGDYLSLGISDSPKPMEINKAMLNCVYLRCAQICGALEQQSCGCVRGHCGLRLTSIKFESSQPSICNIHPFWPVLQCCTARVYGIQLL